MKTISREQRARQFMPFASLRGYYAYVRRQRGTGSRAGSFPTTRRRNCPRRSPGFPGGIW